ncbi:alpha/beta hydrolase [Sphingobacteriaceae bacterium]|nr:alpha/beta hydrolase [Sphingobacteriaceae bacterium]
MDYELRTVGKVTVAELKSEAIVLKSVEDALDLLGNAGYQGATHIIIFEKNISPDFFDLKTGFAGELLQKFSTYSMRLSIIGDFSKFESKSLRDFIYESNTVGKINFLRSMQEVEEKILSIFGQ